MREIKINKQKLKSKTAGGVKLKSKAAPKKAAPKKKASPAKKRVIRAVKSARKTLKSGSPTSSNISSTGRRIAAKAKAVAKQYGLRTGKNIVTGKNLKSKVAKRGASKSKKK